MTKYDWIKEIPDYKQYFTRDQQDLIDLIGIDNYLKIHEYFEKTSIHFSSAPIMMLKKIYAIKNHTIPYNECARLLGVSEKTIYNWREEKNLNNDLDLFDKK